MKRLTVFAQSILMLAGFPAAAQVPQQLNYQGRVSVQGVNFTGTGQFKFALVDAGYNQHQTATASGTVLAGEVTSITVSIIGSGYPAPPAVTITDATPGGMGAGATAVAVMGQGPGTGTGPTDSVHQITVTNPGSGYTGGVIVTIAPPPPNYYYNTYWSNDGTSVNGGQPTAAVSLPVVNGLYSLLLGDTALSNMTTVPTSVFSANSDVRLRVWFDDGTHGFQQLTPDQRLTSAPFAFTAGAVTDGAITSTKIQNGAVGAAQIANGAVTLANLANGSISPAKLVTPAAPTAGQVLRFDGTQFTWASEGLSLPYGGGAATTSAAFSIQNNSTGAAIEGYGTTGDGVKGYTAAAGKSAVYGQNNTFTGGGQGVYGFGFFNAVGVLGVSNGGDGVSGRTNGTGKTGVFGYAEGEDSSGLHGSSLLHHGLYAYTGSTNRAAIWANAPNGAEAIHGHSDGGDGVVGYTGAAGKSGVIGLAGRADNHAVAAINGAGTGLLAKTDAATATAAFFWNSAGGDAIRTDGDANIGGAVTAGGDGIFTGRLEANAGMAAKENGGFVLSAGGGKIICWKNTDFYAGLDILGDLDMINGDAFKNGDLFWDSPSDRRLKTPGDGYTRGLADLTRIKTLKFRYKPGNAANMPDDKEQVGVIAQELQQVFPEAVSTNGKGFLTVNATPVFWGMVNAIKELKAENDSLKKQLGQENAALRKRLDALEAASR